MGRDMATAGSGGRDGGDATPRRAALQPITDQSAGCTQAATMSVEIPLVHEIEKRQCLYNFNLPEYNKKDTLDAAWLEVAAAVNLTVNECKDKWKNIRSSFVRSLRTNGGKSKKLYYLSKYLHFVTPYLKAVSGVEFNPDDSQTTQPQPIDIELNDESSQILTVKMEPEFEGEQMRHYEVVSFDPMDVPKEREKPACLGNTMRRRRQPMPMKNYTMQQRNKNKRLHTPFVLRTENNALKYFLLSLMPELETLEEDQIRLFKIKVMMLIDEIKSDSANVKADLPSSSENTRLQKRLINLLLKNLEKKNDLILGD